MKNKRGLEMSFAWMFAILVGAVIIFLAIFGTTRLVNTERIAADSEAGKELGVLLTPVETGIEEARISKIRLPVESRVFNSCRTEGNFGRQGISIATKSGLGEEWSDPGVESAFFNKYVFSDGVVQGRNLEIFSSKFEMGFEVGSVVFLWSEERGNCLVNPPKDVEDELGNLNSDGINITGSIGECREGDKKICFGSELPGCDVSVSLESKTVSQEGRIVRYEDSFDNSLLYGAIFGEVEVYECQVKRLMKRASELALLNLAKAEYLGSKGCSFEHLEGDLALYAQLASSLGSSSDLANLGLLAQKIRRDNDDLHCKLF